jgi:hypothetical protein
MARVPTEPARAAPAVTGTEVLVGAVPLPLGLGAAVPVLALEVTIVEALVVEAAAVEPLVEEVPAAEVVAAAEVVPAAEVVVLEPPEATAAQNFWAAGRTSLRATSEPQAAMMAEAAAPWMAAWFAEVHWQA